MRRSDDPVSPAQKAPDWLALTALVWTVGFGLAYAEMIVRARAPRVAAAIRRAVGQEDCKVRIGDQRSEIGERRSEIGDRRTEKNPCPKPGG